MIQITDELRKDIIRTYEKLGAAEFYRILNQDESIDKMYKDSNESIFDYLDSKKTISAKLADRFKNIMADAFFTNHFKSASHFLIPLLRNQCVFAYRNHFVSHADYMNNGNACLG